VCGGKDADNLIDEGLSHGFDALEVEDHGFELCGPSITQLAWDRETSSPLSCASRAGTSVV